MEAGLADLLLEHGPDPLLLLAPDGSISYLNTAAEELFGYSRSQLLGTDAGLLLAAAFRAEFRALLAGLARPAPRAGEPIAGHGRRADGTEIPVEITCSLLPAAEAGSAAPSVALSVRGAGHRTEPHPKHPDDGGGTAGGAAHRRRTLAASTAAPAAFAGRDDQVRAGVLRDPLTSLPNGTLFNERLAAALRRPDPVDVLLLSLDDLKNLTGLLGRSAADELLVEVASLLRNCVRPHDTVARLGGDEFVVLLTECQNADSVAARIAESLSGPLRVGGSLVRPGVSMGLASRSSPTLDGAELLRRADTALTAAKSAARDGGRNAWLRFRPEMLNTGADVSAAADMSIGADGQAGLRQAVELGEVSVHYQPVVSPGRGAVVQFEAFARWERHGRLVPPNQFLPVAEQSGLIREIGDEVLRRACAEIRPWLAGDAACSVSVNVSGLQFQNRDFATEVLAILASAGVDPRQLRLELTESAFFGPDSAVLRQLSALRAAGVRIAMDDFGTGYLSPDGLAELPLDEVKIDRSLVAMIRSGQELLPLLGTMIDAAHALGLQVTAEGVETAEQAKYLMDRGCDSLQGYLFARPAPAGGLAGAVESALTTIDKVDAAG
ncbi:diguanylate cyclase (GGDEF)-like protein/PAS domain S-box-containing protein [Pseudarthrobacter oxydans]|uniref:sensor domain-containing protein n=1 Tax=Pseudarthrobacter oxydans TaxID=1671 RepID=UPI00278A1029|nr:EAL domain-containing protein [Pseudarthrobacter oxydans]MDP9981679.1 diguanylate cyclase (GGDEF)-like protein/PAS domain S-box-containing protein [Pseudarthrobacter oxydans]